MADAKKSTRGQADPRADRDARPGSSKPDSMPAHRPGARSMFGFLAAIWIVGAVVALAVLFWVAVN